MTDTTNKAMTLEPCPFCGKPAEIVDDYNESNAWFNLGCSDEKCVAHNFVYGQNPEWRDETIAAWNKRAHLSAQHDCPQCAECSEYLKEGETPKQRMDRDFKDNQTLLGMLAAERKKVEELTAQREGDAVAWMTEDGRVATSYTKEHSMPKASKDAFNIPLYAAPPIASQREGEPVAWLVTREGDPAFPFVFIKEDMADRWISNVTLTPFAQKHPLYATPSPPRAVTDDDVHRAIAAQMKRVAEGGCTPFDSMRAALEAALSERTS